MLRGLMTDLLLKVGSIVILLGGLIFVHELGHFIAAKLLGVKVVRFSIGFGPRLFGFTRGETEYRVAILPLGGYVKMAGDDPSKPLAPEDRGRGFLEQKPWRRFVIAFAGPAMNLVFPAVVYFGLTLAQNGSQVPGPRVGSLAPGAPAAQAGLQPGDRILSVTVPGEASRPVRWFSDLRDLVAPHPGEPLVFDVERDGQRLPPVTIRPARELESNPIETTARGVIGVTPAYTSAVVAPVRSGAAGPLEPFDRVLSVNGQKVAHAGDLRRALAAAGCAPVAMEVARDSVAAAATGGAAVPGPAAATPAPGASAGTATAATARETRSLSGVPTCDAEGKPTFTPADPGVSTYIASVDPGSPADQAGLRRGDAIAAMNGERVLSYRDLNARSAAFTRGQPVELTLADGRNATLMPEERVELDELTREPRTQLVLGFQPLRSSAADLDALLVETVPLSVGPAEAARVAVRNLNEVTRLTVLGIARIVTGDISFKTVGGPIMLFQIAAQAAKEGLESFLFKMALISVNLGLMNLLPVPVLDGGHMVASVLEGVTRRPLSLRAREVANMVGIVLLLTLMVFVFKNDIARLMG